MLLCSFLNACLIKFNIFYSYESRPNGGFSVFYTLPQTTADKTSSDTSSSSDRLAKLIREVKKNVAGQADYKMKTTNDNNNVEDDDEGEEDKNAAVDNSVENQDKPVKTEKKNKKPKSDGYREDYYEEGGYNEEEDDYSYTDRTHLDGPPDKSGNAPPRGLFSVQWQTHNNWARGL